MIRKDWNNWLQISSTLAVLAGVVLVIAQLRQNAELIELQILKQESESYIQNFAEILPENFTQVWLKAIDDPQSLSRDEIFAVDIYLYARSVARWRAMYDLAERGLLEDSEWRQRVAEDAPSALAYPFGRAWWEGIKEWGATLRGEHIEAPLPDELVDAIDRALAQEPLNGTAEWIDELEKQANIDRAGTSPSEPSVGIAKDSESTEN